MNEGDNYYIYDILEWEYEDRHIHRVPFDKKIFL